MASVNFTYAAVAAKTSWFFGRAKTVMAAGNRSTKTRITRTFTLSLVFRLNSRQIGVISRTAMTRVTIAWIK